MSQWKRQQAAQQQDVRTCAFDDGGELWVTDAGLLAGRAHRARTNADLDDVRAAAREARGARSARREREKEDANKRRARNGGELLISERRT